MALSQEKQKQFVNDYKSGMKTSDLTKKYSITNNQYTYQLIYKLKQKGLIHKVTDHSTTMKKAWETRRANLSNGEKKSEAVTNKPLTDYRTVYFKDFTVQIHKKAMARLVVDHNNNLHILNN